MRRALLNYARQSTFNTTTIKSSKSPSSLIRFFSSSSEDDSTSSSSSSSTTQNPSNFPDTISSSSSSLNHQDINNKEFKARLDKYLQENDEDALPTIFEAVLTRKLVKKHQDTDDELMEEFQFTPVDDVTNQDFEDDFEELYETDEEIDNLYNARDYVQKKMVKDDYFNMDDNKWDEMIKEATEKGFLKDTTECEQILEDMLSWDKLLPDEIKQQVEAKFSELGDMCERGELEPEEAYELFKEFEDQMVEECIKMESEKPRPPPHKQISVPENKLSLDDPPGEGPILRWQSRVVFAPGGDAWHPKNRKVKLSVTVKELGLSKHAFRRLREVVGKRYHPGKDELTVTSERYEHREENRKDCLRTLYSLIEDAVQADKLVEKTRASYVKERLKANPEFMERLRAKTVKMRSSVSAPTV